MSQHYLTPDERDEYNAMLADAAESSKFPKQRAEWLLHLLCRHGSEWASEMLRDLQIAGAQKELNSYERRTQRIAVAYNGRTVSKPRKAGAPRRKSDGSYENQRTLIDFYTWDQLERKAQECVAFGVSNAENLHKFQRLLRLRDLVPTAANPYEACAELGITVEAWLSESAA